MSVILGEYKYKRKLGKGAFGDVLLVENEKGEEFALKVISKKILQKDPFMEEYLEGEKQCMMSVKSPYVMKLLDFREDENNKYFVCQYCEGGDLLNNQAKQPNKVYVLKDACKIMTDVIWGLDEVHKLGYLHRDIKSQNILLKANENCLQAVGVDHWNYKLADFGFAKKSNEIGGTVLGTEHYMAPEIFLNEVYSFEVDMWAFGVLFYFMLNMEFPFKINPHASLEQKRSQLIKQANCFVFSEAVKNSKKKNIQNCSPEMDDLFKKIFIIEQDQRITFFEIREHPIFKEYFPQANMESKILYNPKGKKMNRYDSFIIGVKSGILKRSIKNQGSPQKKPEEKEDFQPSMVLKKKKGGSQEKHYLEIKYERIKFLYDAEEQLVQNCTFLGSVQLLALRYNLLKYYIILLHLFIKGLKSEHLENENPKLKWKDFCKTNDFTKFRNAVTDTLGDAQIQLSQTYDTCKSAIYEIVKINPKFELTFEPEVKDYQFSGNFKTSYRDSTGRVYEKTRSKFSEGNKYVYFTTLALICHSFNQFSESSEATISQIFADYAAERKYKEGLVDTTELMAWMSNSSKDKLKKIIKSIMTTYFSS